MKSLKKLISLCLLAACSLGIAASMLPICGSSQESYGNLKYQINDNGTIAITGCTDNNVESVVIPESIGGKAVTEIFPYAFAHKMKLKDITIPKSITKIEGAAFFNTPWLDLKIRDNPLVTVNSIVIDATKCEGDIVIPSDVTSISDYAFSRSGVTSVVIPETVTEIGASTFSGCSALKSVKLPNSIQNIGSTAFNKCRGLTEITIPESVSVIENHAFFGCSGLKKVIIENPECSLDGNSVFTTLGGNTGEPFIGTIYGNESSTAHEYADKYNCKFLAINEYGVIGDANGDGNISPIDVSMIFTEYKKLYRKEKGSFTANQNKLCDLNGNKTINASDASSVFSIYKKNYRRSH